MLTGRGLWSAEYKYLCLYTSTTALKQRLDLRSRSIIPFLSIHIYCKSSHIPISAYPQTVHHLSSQTNLPSLPFNTTTTLDVQLKATHKMGCGLSVPSTRFGATAGQEPIPAMSSTTPTTRFGATAGQPPMPASEPEPTLRARSSEDRQMQKDSKRAQRPTSGNGFAGYGRPREPERGWA